MDEVLGSLPIVVIAGRPNVGKSTLFNRLVGRRTAIVADTPGVTRDRKEAEAMLRGRLVKLVDTAGDVVWPDAGIVGIRCLLGGSGVVRG